MTEEQAKDWLDTLASDAQRADDRRMAVWNLAISIIGGLVAIMALIWTIVTDRRSRAANDRSIRNEVQIEALKEAERAGG